MSHLEIVNRQRHRVLTKEQKKLLADVVENVLSCEDVKNPCDVAMTLVSNKKIREINRTFREIDRETDVLSFPSGDFPAETEDEPVFLGDIAISIEKAEAQANEYGHSFEREIAFLTAHSMLHLLGYDHMEPGEETVMFGKQEEILTKMGITR